MKRLLLALLLCSISAFAQARHARQLADFSPAELAQVGANAAQQVPAGRDPVQWAAAREEVQKIARRLMESPASAPRAVVEMVDSADGDMNAQVLPIGDVVTVNYALVRFLKDDSELAAIIAHELGHLYDAAHNGCQFGVQRTDEEQRACEATADRLSLVFLVAARYDPYGAGGAFGKMMMFTGQGTTVMGIMLGRFESNHPVSLDRISSLRNTLIQICQLAPSGCHPAN